MSDYLNFSIQTRKEFRDWIFRKLGYPIITPELTSDMLDDCINDALEEFTEIGAQDQKYYGLNLKDYIGGKGYIMPTDVVSVTNLYDQGISGNGGGTGVNPFSLQYMMANGGFVPNPFSGLGSRSGWFDYHLIMSWLDMAYQMTGKGFEWNYNPRTKLLTLNPDPIKYFNINFDEHTDEGYYIVVECETIRPEEQNYGESWVKRMALANAKIAWGNIRTAYSGVNLPGGIQVSGESLVSSGQKEQEDLRNEIRARYPAIGMWIG